MFKYKSPKGVVVVAMVTFDILLLKLCLQNNSIFFEILCSEKFQVGITFQTVQL